MIFGEFSADELRLINRRTIERLRMQRVPSQDTAERATPTALTLMFGNSQAAKFSRIDIRNAFIAASKRLSERT